METKVCSKCETEKSLDEFFFRNKKTGRRHAQCKGCYNNGRNYKEHYEKYKEEYKERANDRIKTLLQENRGNMIDYLKKHSCVDCGETRIVVLEFDHLDRDKKEYGIAKMMKHFTWDKIQKEMNKCEVVCANCHRVRTAKQFNWYKLED